MNSTNPSPDSEPRMPASRTRLQSDGSGEVLIDTLIQDVSDKDVNRVLRQMQRDAKRQRESERRNRNNPYYQMLSALKAAREWS